MCWLAKSENDAGAVTLGKRSWRAAGQVCSNAGLTAQALSGYIEGIN